MAISIGGGAIFGDNSNKSSLNSANDRGSLIGITTFTSSGTYYVPTNCTKLYVKLVGGGGGSAGYCESGGAGGYAEGPVFGLTAGTSVAVTVGGGGAGVGYYAAGSGGGTSSFGSYISATGGNGANTSYGHTGGYGGVGSAGAVKLQGGGGTGHGNSMGYGGIGKGGASFFGGTHGVRHSGNEQIGSGAPGAGASGGITDTASAGRAGANGIVIVYAYR